MATDSLPPPMFMLVPAEPTGQMIEAGMEAAEIHYEYGVDLYVENMAECYQAMINAVPHPQPVAWLQIGVGPHEGDCMARLNKPTAWNPDWWRFEPLYAARGQA